MQPGFKGSIFIDIKLTTLLKKFQLIRYLWSGHQYSLLDLYFATWVQPLGRAICAVALIYCFDQPHYTEFPRSINNSWVANIYFKAMYQVRIVIPRTQKKRSGHILICHTSSTIARLQKGSYINYLSATCPIVKMVVFFDLLAYR